LLDHASILVAENEPFIALDLALAIEDAGGVVVGPAASCQEALALLATTVVVAAILDLDLLDGDCSAVVERLVGAGVPVILQTGGQIPPTLTARFPGVVVQIKPFVAANLIARLEVVISNHQERGVAAANSLIIVEQNAGRSSGLREVTSLRSTTTSSSTH